MDGREGKKLSTGELMRRLFNTASIGKFMKRNDAEMQAPDLCALLSGFAEARALEPHEVVRAAHIDRIYGYQIFTGARRPSRDKTIMLAIALRLSVDEAQRLLRAAGRSELYARVKRDAALLFCLNKGLDMDGAQSLLEELSLPLLGGIRNDADGAGA